MKKEWQAQWVIDPKFSDLEPINVFHKQLTDIEIEEHPEELTNRHMLIRKSFNLESLGEEALIRITADDYYKLYINGQFVGQGPAPAYHKHYNYNIYDIKSYLNEGINTIAVHVYYQGLINRVWNSGDYRQGMIAELHIDDEMVLGTDTSWRYKISKAYVSGGITGYKTQYLENFDSRLWEYDWNEVGYDDSTWLPVGLTSKTDYMFVEQESDNISVYTMKPKSVQSFDQVRYLIDFGQEITGQFQMSAEGLEGQTIEIRCGEELEEADQTRVRYKMRCNCDYQEFWILSGNEDLLNLYDYKAFRYVEVIIPEGVIHRDSFSAVVRHYPFDNKRFTYESSDTLVDQVMQVCKMGVKYGAQEVYVDCPTREKGQYLGDFTVTGHSHIYLTGDATLYKKTLMDFAYSSEICPGIMAVAPGAFMQEIADFSMQWPMQIFQYYRQTGDTEFLEEIYPYVVNLEKYFKQFEREDGLLVGVGEKWNLVDWPDNLRDGYDDELTQPIGPECHNVVNAHYYGMSTYIQKIRDVLEIEGNFNLVAFKKSFVAAFYNVQTKLYVDREGSLHSAVHSNALPLLFDLFPTQDLKTPIAFVKSKEAKYGVQFSYFVLKALAKVGEYEEVYRLIGSMWKTMVEEGATTCYEAWGKDQKWNTSLCHPWASAPIAVMVEDIIGLNPGQPGWELISFTPHIPDHLEYFRLEIKIRTGNIIIEKKEGDLSIKGPKGVKICVNTEKNILL